MERGDSLGLTDRVKAWFGGASPKAAAPSKVIQTGNSQGGFLRLFNVSQGPVTVTQGQMEAVGAVASCVNVLSQDLAKLPALVYEKTGNAKRIALDHPVYKLLYVAPNRRMTPFQFKQFKFRSVLYRGNAFAQIIFDGYQRPKALNPLHPDYVTVRLVQVGDDLEKVYDVETSNGKIVTLPQREVLHIMGDSGDGIAGNSPVKQYALSLGFAYHTAEFGANVFKNGAHSSLAVEVPLEIATGDPEKQQAFYKEFEDRQSGTDNAGRPIYMDPGTKIHQISMTPESAQFLDSRRFSRNEIAGIFRVPSHKIGDNADMKYNNVEMAEIAYKNDGLLPWATQDEEECLRKLFTEEERSRYEVRYQWDALVRADSKTRAEANEILLRTGQRTINETRTEDGFAPVEGGDVNLVPLNMTTYQAMDGMAWDPKRSTSQ